MVLVEYVYAIPGFLRHTKRALGQVPNWPPPKVPPIDVPALQALALWAAVLIVAGAGIAAVVIAIRSPDLFATSAEAALLRDRLTVVEDSLALARSELEAAQSDSDDDAAGDRVRRAEARIRAVERAG